ncbi:endonuclease domain-containing protein [Phenylobacterium kunshanense]|nr:endonuclease domain-containing protein [Phenylobacterium kunshanense]
MLERAPGAIHKSDRADRAARRMRRVPTYAERDLWKVLRKTDLHFRRQVPLGSYIVDFACHDARLIVELDGGIHDLPSVAARDLDREAWLTGRGYRVMRFSNNEHPEDVVRVILERISADTPTPDPSPQGGGEQKE